MTKEIRSWLSQFGTTKFIFNSHIQGELSVAVEVLGF